MPNDFDALGEQLEALRKSMSTDPIEVDRAKGKEKGDGAGGDDENTGDGTGNGEMQDSGLAEDETMTKSMTLADGRTVEFVDGSEMMKSLGAKVDKLETENSDLKADLAKSLKATSTVVDLLKSLRAEVGRIGNAGGGRRSIAAVHEVTGTKAVDPKDPLRGMSRDEVLEKSMDLFGKGELTGHDVARIEGYVIDHRPIPSEYHSKIFAAAGK